MKKLVLLFCIAFALSSCGVFNQIEGAYTLSQSEYKYHSLSNIQLSGLNLGDASRISVSNLASISTILSGTNSQSIPFNMTLTMEVKNPNQTVAFLNALDYAIEINEMEFASGKMDIPIRIEPGKTELLPISIGTDLKQLMNRYSQNRVAKEMSSFLGITSEKTIVTVKLWPKLIVADTPIRVPAPIPVIFTFGGKE